MSNSSVHNLQGEFLPEAQDDTLVFGGGLFSSGPPEEFVRYGSYELDLDGFPMGTLVPDSYFGDGGTKGCRALKHYTLAYPFWTYVDDVTIFESNQQ